MGEFNNNSHKLNVVKASTIGVTTDLIRIFLGFFYRTVFVHYFSAEYLGINGLFSNVLQILSLADLGISTSISFRLYEPISSNNIEKVGQIMNFFKKVYRIIAIIIFSVGISVTPFINSLINSDSIIPDGLNLKLVYILFLLNTVSTYLFSYKLTILSADQKNYIVNIVNTISLGVGYILQFTVMILTHRYSLTLFIGICSNILINIISSLWVTKLYPSVFKIKKNLEKSEQKSIFHDTNALMFHKVGTTVLQGTDNIILSKMVSLVATGLYSNYSLVLVNFQSLFSKIFGNFTSTIGNTRITKDKDGYYDLYKQMNFLNLWCSAFLTICFFICIDDFINLWLGEKFVFSILTTSVLCFQFYLSTASQITGVFSNAAGLFVKDKIRPIIESLLNLIISIVLAKFMGIVGVFLGTVISNMLTVWWRVPYILFKNDFKSKPISDYWKQNLSFMFFTFIACMLFYVIKQIINIKINFLTLCLEGFIILILSNLLLFIVFHRCNEYVFLKDQFFKMIYKLKRKM